MLHMVSFINTPTIPSHTHTKQLLNLRLRFYISSSRQQYLRSNHLSVPPLYLSLSLSRSVSLSLVSIHASYIHGRYVIFSPPRSCTIPTHTRIPYPNLIIPCTPSIFYFPSFSSFSSLSCARSFFSSKARFTQLRPSSPSQSPT